MPYFCHLSDIGIVIYEVKVFSRFMPDYFFYMLQGKGNGKTKKKYQYR